MNYIELETPANSAIHRTGVDGGKSYVAIKVCHLIPRANLNLHGHFYTTRLDSRANTSISPTGQSL